MRYPLLKFFFISLLEEVNPLGLLHMSTFLQAKGHAVTTVFAPLNPKEVEFGVEENRLIEDGEIHEKEASKAQASTAVSCPARALCDCDGSLWRRELLGKGNEGFGS